MAPEPPQDVRITMADGSEVPVECVYVGWDGQTHNWQAVIEPDRRPASMSIGVLPARTSVSIGWPR